jgi:hypothetical protein
MYAEGERAKEHGTPQVGSGGKPKESLAETTKRLRARLKDRSIEVAEEIVTMSKNWDTWAPQADGKSFGKWLRTFTRRPLAYFRDLAEQVVRHRKLRTDMLGKVEPRVIYWARSATDEELQAGSIAIAAAFRQGGSVMLSQSQASRIMPELVRAQSARGRDRMQELQARIGRLIEQVRALGAEPVE